MKIAQICPRYHPDLGGVQTYVKEISERLCREGFELEVLTMDSTGRLPNTEIIGGVAVKRFKSYTFGNAYTFSPQFEKYLKVHADEYEVLHAHQYHALPAYYVSRAKKAGTKFVFNTYYHGKGHTLFRNILHIPYKLVGRSILKRSDKIVCLSEHEKRTLLKNFALDQNKIHVIPCGIEIDEFKNVKKKCFNARILTVSRLEKHKGIDSLIQTLPFLDSNITLEIIGKGPYKEALVELSNRLKVSNRVMFLQDLSREALVQKYFESDLFVLLSQHESYGIVVLEALASGTSVIVADTSALSEWVDGIHCYGVKYPVDVKELARLITRVIGRPLDKKDLPSWTATVQLFKSLYIGLREQ